MRRSAKLGVAKAAQDRCSMAAASALEVLDRPCDEAAAARALESGIRRQLDDVRAPGELGSGAAAAENAGRVDDVCVRGASADESDTRQMPQADRETARDPVHL